MKNVPSLVVKILGYKIYSAFCCDKKVADLWNLELGFGECIITLNSLGSSSRTFRGRFSRFLGRTCTVLSLDSRSVVGSYQAVVFEDSEDLESPKSCSVVHNTFPDRFSRLSVIFFSRKVPETSRIKSSN